MAANDKVLTVPLSHIEFDPKWNVRADLEGAKGLEEDVGIEGLQKSIAVHGQDTPIIVRHNPKKGSAQPYVLVDGFRRREAVARNGVAQDVKDPPINVIVNESLTDDGEAFAFNLRCAVDRAVLSVADTCFGINRAKKLNPKANQATLADMLGCQQSYISKHLKVGTEVKPKLLEQWRAAPKKLTLDQMWKIADLPKDEQEEAYNAIARPNDGGDGETVSATAWVKNAQARAEVFGTAIGHMVRTKQIKVYDEPGLFTAETIGEYVKCKKGAKAGERVRVAASAMKAYKHERDREESEDEEETSEDTAARVAGKGAKKTAKTKNAKKTAKAKNAKAANGATATAAN